MKNNRFTRAIALVMTLVMALSLVACGHKPAVTPDDTAKPAVTETDKAKDNAPVADKKTADANADKAKADANKTTADADKAETKADNASKPADSKSDSKNTNSNTTAPAQKPASSNQSTAKPSSGNTGSSTKTETKTPTQPSQPTKPTEPSKPAHSHSYTAKTVAPTCTDKGYTKHTCSCGDSYKDSYKDALGHSYSKKVVEPTTSAGGYTQYTCSRCGKSYKDNYTDPIKDTSDTIMSKSDLDRLCAEANAYAKSIGMKIDTNKEGYGSGYPVWIGESSYSDALRDLEITIKSHHDGVAGADTTYVLVWYQSGGDWGADYEICVGGA